VAGTTSISREQLAKHMATICDLGFHMYCKTLIRSWYKDITQSTLPSDGSVAVLQFDWKANVDRGRGGIEDSSVIHNVVRTTTRSTEKMVVCSYLCSRMC